MSEDMQRFIFKNNLNNILAEKRKTQKEVAEAIGVSPQTFNTWCQGIAIPRMGKIQLLADYFGINKSDLIDPPSSPAASGVQIELTEVEAEHIRRYRYLDESGREFVDTVLNREYDRCAAEKGSLSSVISC